jgi:glycosyltransferase involved in cell wall biosynthesis
MKVCIVAEGSYPIVRGGVSEWTHQLIKGLNNIEYDIFCLSPLGNEEPIYEKLPNIGNVIIRQASQAKTQSNGRKLPRSSFSELCDCLEGTFHGKPIDCKRIVKLVEHCTIPKEWQLSKEYWNFIVTNYEQMHSNMSFSEFFWTTHNIFVILIDAINIAKTLPQASAYHSLTTGMGGLVAVITAAIHGKPILVSEHGLYLKERSIELSRQNVTPETRQLATDFFVSMVRTSYENADFLLPICQAYADNEVAIGASREKIRVITNGIDVTKFLPVEKQISSRPIVGCFARVVPVKDQLSLIKASKKVLDLYPADFVFVGEIQDEEYYQECQTLVNELKVNDYVRFIGHTDNVADWYHKSDIFVLSSQTEGLPLALLEAMSCGIPCVCTAVGGVPEVISDTGVGYVVPPGDTDKLASSISILLNDNSLRKSMGEKATKLAREKYTVQTMQSRIVDVYNEATNRYIGTSVKK